MRNKTILRSILLSLSALVASGEGNAFASGNPDIVGILASITEPSNAAELGLTQDQLDRLETLIKQHESRALTFASEVRQLPSAERRAKESENIRMIERQGLALLNETQQATAELWRRQKLGAATLIEPEVAKLMGVSEEQIAKMKNVMEGKSTLIREMGRTKGEAELNKRLVAILDDSQKTVWQTMVGKPLQNEAVAEVASSEKTVALPTANVSTREQPVMTGPADGLVINFNNAPWKDVLKWIAKEAELSLQGDSYPQGSFTYQDKFRRYSVAEAMDVMNGVLLGKGYTLVKKQRVLIPVDLGSGDNADVIRKYIADLAELVSPEELKDRGTFEILKCVFKPERSSVEELEKEVKALIGPTGSVVSFPTIGQVMVCETGGKLRIIRDLISGGSSTKKIEKIVLKHVSADEVLAIARPLLGLKDGINTSDDLSISTDTFGNFILATGSADKLQKLKDISTEIDIKPSEDGTKTIAAEPSFLKSHRLQGSDGDTTWDILQSTFAGQTNMKLSRDPKTGNIIAEAIKADHEKIDNIINELAGQNSDFEVIQLTRLDTQTAMLTLEKFYGKAKTGTDAATAKGPIFSPDTASKKITVKGTKEEIEQVRKLLTTVEASSPEVESLMDGILLLPYRGKAAERMLDSIDMLREAKKSRFRVILPESKSKVSSEKAQEPAPKVQKDGRSAQAVAPINPFSKLVVVQETAASTVTVPVAAPLEPQSKNDVIIRQGPNGLIVTSEDKDALREFNQLYKIAEEQSRNTPAEPTQIVLKYIKAAAAAELINGIIAGEKATASSGGGGGGLLGEVASSVLGGGGIFGGMFGGGGGGGSSSASNAVSGSGATGTVSIFPDARLNALWVQANGADMQMVEDLVTMIDIPDSGVENYTRGTPETIFIENVAVEEIEAIVKQVFADRIAQAPGAAAQRQPSPQEFLALIGGGGGRRGGGGGGGAAQSEIKEQTMTISSDKKNNALIVVAPPMLFQDVKKLVTQMDQASKDDEKDVVVMPMPAEVNPTTMQNALKSAFGASVKTSTGTSSTPGTTGATTGNPADFLQQFRNRGGAAGGQGGFGGFGGAPGGFGGAPGGFGGAQGGFGGQRGGFGGNQGGGGFGGAQGGGGQRGGTQGGGQRGGNTRGGR